MQNPSNTTLDTHIRAHLKQEMLAQGIDPGTNPYPDDPNIPWEGVAITCGCAVAVSLNQLRKARQSGIKVHSHKFVPQPPVRVEPHAVEVGIEWMGMSTKDMIAIARDPNRVEKPSTVRWHHKDRTPRIDIASPMYPELFLIAVREQGITKILNVLFDEDVVVPGHPDYPTMMARKAKRKRRPEQW